MTNRRLPQAASYVAEILARGEVVTAAFIAAAVGCSERTIHRHIDRLRKDGMRIDGERGVGFLARRPR